MSEWHEDLFGCTKDLYGFLILLTFPFACCVYQGLAVNRSSGDSCISAFLCSLVFLCVGSAINRGKIRDVYLIRGSFLSDC